MKVPPTATSGLLASVPRGQGPALTVAVALVILGGAALRLVGLDHLSLGIDEGYTLAFSRQPWDEVLGLNGYYDFHPPLFYSLAKLAEAVASEAVASRLVAAVGGSLTLLVVYLLCVRLVDRVVALAATLLVAVSPLHLFYSRWGRTVSYTHLTLPTKRIV